METPQVMHVGLNLARRAPSTNPLSPIAVRIASLPANPDQSLNRRITPELVQEHQLLPEEFELIKRLLHREPSLTELGAFAAMWDERRSYKNTKALLRQFPSSKDGDCSRFGEVLVKAGEDNAGVVDIGGGWAIAFRIESGAGSGPSDAIAGAGSIIREILTLGAKPVLMTNSLRMGELSSPISRQDLRRSAEGLALMGKASGVPMVGGDVYLDKSYEGSPLVNALCLGIVRHDALRRTKVPAEGISVFCIGAPVGRQGPRVGKSAMSVLQEDELAFEKRLIEACLSLSSSDLVEGLQDIGAAGLCGALCKALSKGGTGVEIDLDALSLREEGMNSYELLLSESTGRMLLLCRKDGEADLQALLKGWDLPCQRIGVISNTGRITARIKGQVVADIPVAALTEKAPLYFREAVVPGYFVETSAWTPENASLPDLDQNGVRRTLPRLLSHPTVASKQWLARQFESKPNPEVLVESGSDATIVRLKLGDTERIIAISNDGNGRLCYLNPRRGAQIAMAESLRNIACSGAVPLAMTDGLNFGNPYKPEAFYQFKEAVRGLAESCRFFDVPVVAGGVSLHNESRAEAIDPTPIVSVVGLVEDEKHITKQWVKEEGESIILIGGVPNEIGGSHYLSIVHGLKKGDAPTIDLGSEERLIATIRTLIRSGMVSAAHDLSDGGLLVAISEMLFAKERTFGARLDLTIAGGGRNDAVLFGESQGRVLLVVKNKSIGRVISEAHMQGVCAAVIGDVTSEPTLAIKTRSLTTSWNVVDLRKVWESSLEEVMKG
jgi:phosphoribosylformylglycinamidine synthase subunit PurL